MTILARGGAFHVKQVAKGERPRGGRRQDPVGSPASAIHRRGRRARGGEADWARMPPRQVRLQAPRWVQWRYARGPNSSRMRLRCGSLVGEPLQKLGAGHWRKGPQAGRAHEVRRESQGRWCTRLEAPPSVQVLPRDRGFVAPGGAGPELREPRLYPAPSSRRSDAMSRHTRQERFAKPRASSPRRSRTVHERRKC